VNGRDINSKVFGYDISSWGYSVNWKWQTGFVFEGSPQFTGDVPAYGMVDAQINKYFPSEKLTIKIGASNLLNNKVIQVYGGPRVGRLAYFSLLFDFSK
jgi:outer membrane receptor protein involved in Fe transport